MSGRPYLRVKQKVLDPAEWLVHGVPHNGTHYLLWMFFNNTGSLSEGAYNARSVKRHGRGRKGGGGGAGQGSFGGNWGERGSGGR